MIFGSAFFYLFLAIFFIGFILLSRKTVPRNALLLLGSLSVYAWIDLKSLPVLLGMTLISYAFARRNLRKPRMALVGVFIVLGTLIFFKFWIRNATGSPADLATGTLLPLGISIYSFQMMGYLLDVYHGRIEAQPRFHEYLNSVSFFPTLGSGPILRTLDFYQQLRKTSSLEWSSTKWALLLICNGLFKKTIADLLALLTGPFLKAPTHDFIDAWTGVLALAAQVYADFSGYSDIAIGIALLLGFRVPENFHLPYLASSVSEHWRRWHISLYEWFNNFVFTPLVLTTYGKSWLRPLGPKKLTGALIIFTMSLIGLWHGFSLSFLIWGVLNGLAIAFNGKIFTGPFRRYIPGLLLTFYLTSLLRLFAFSDDPIFVWSVWQELHKPFLISGHMLEKIPYLVVVILSIAIPHALDFQLIKRKEWFVNSPWTLIVMASLLAFILTLSMQGVPFIYLRF